MVSQEKGHMFWGPRSRYVLVSNDSLCHQSCITCPYWRCSIIECLKVSISTRWRWTSTIIICTVALSQLDFKYIWCTWLDSTSTECGRYKIMLLEHIHRVRQKWLRYLVLFPSLSLSLRDHLVIISTLLCFGWLWIRYELDWKYIVDWWGNWSPRERRSKSN